MRQVFIVFFVVLGLIALVVFFSRRDETRQGPPERRPEVPGEETASPGKEQGGGGGNTTIADFRAAKKLATQVYRGMEVTFYCGCTYTGKLANLASCGFVPVLERERAYRIEWEHVVPAHDFGQSFKAWREGDARCVNGRGKPFKGRSCARLVSGIFRRMEADLYNLVPEIGELNQRRSNYPMGLLPGVEAMFGSCETKIARGVIEPRPAVRGFVARTYQYMDVTYPGHGIISRKNRKLFAAWDKEYPPTALEIERARRIARLQGNPNPFVLEPASKRSQVLSREQEKTPQR